MGFTTKLTIKAECPANDGYDSYFPQDFPLPWNEVTVTVDPKATGAIAGTPAWTPMGSPKYADCVIPISGQTQSGEIEVTLSHPMAEITPSKRSVNIIGPSNIMTVHSVVKYVDASYPNQKRFYVVFRNYSSVVPQLTLEDFHFQYQNPSGGRLVNSRVTRLVRIFDSGAVTNGVAYEFEFEFLLTGNEDSYERAYISATPSSPLYPGWYIQDFHYEPKISDY